jgi:hypothetical protein
MTIAPGVVEQCEQTFRNIETALKQAGRSSKTSCAPPSSCPTAPTGRPAGRW